MHPIDAFEQPLNERYRLFLRMEQLFARVEHHVEGDTAWDTHAALHTILDLQQTLSRGDSRQEIIRELERQRAALSRFEADSAVDSNRLRAILDKQEQRLDALHGDKGTLGHELRNNELLNHLQQRGGLGGRPVSIEMASYQEWLQRPPADRRDTIRGWLEPLAAARAAVRQCLELTRDSAEWQALTATDGYYEQTLPQHQVLQLLRIRLPGGGHGRFPEISAGRQRFSVRFFDQRDPAERSEQVMETTRFELACCGM